MTVSTTIAGQVAEDYEDYEPEEMLEPLDIPDEDEYIDEIVKKTKQAPAMYEGVGEAGFDGKVGGYWFGQPGICRSLDREERSHEGVSKNPKKDVHVTIKGNKGYSSLAFLHKLRQQLEEKIIEKGFENNDVTILYNGDWAPLVRI